MPQGQQQGQQQGHQQQHQNQIQGQNQQIQQRQEYPRSSIPKSKSQNDYIYVSFNQNEFFNTKKHLVFEWENAIFERKQVYSNEIFRIR